DYYCAACDNSLSSPVF
nr:immunoglobulin light chain junction region [Macaca mulatta]MOW01850.1 immunoglobulin light chain junction region [Macaca mulatta]